MYSARKHNILNISFGVIGSKWHWLQSYLSDHSSRSTLSDCHQCLGASLFGYSPLMFFYILHSLVSTSQRMVSRISSMWITSSTTSNLTFSDFKNVIQITDVGKLPILGQYSPAKFRTTIRLNHVPIGQHLRLPKHMRAVLPRDIATTILVALTLSWLDSTKQIQS